MTEIKEQPTSFSEIFQQSIVELRTKIERDLGENKIDPDTALAQNLTVLAVAEINPASESDLLEALTEMRIQIFREQLHNTTRSDPRHTLVSKYLTDVHDCIFNNLHQKQSV